MHTFDPIAGTGSALFTLAITRTVYATDLMSGERLRYRVRNWALVA
jgi:hypothetical protein